MKKKNTQPTLLFVFFCFLFVLSPGQSFQSQIDSLKNLLERNPVPNEQVDLLNHLAYAFRRTHPDSLYHFGHQALALASKNSYEKGIAIAYKNMGIAHYKFGSQSDTIIFYYEQSQKFAEKAEDYYTQIALLNNIGIVNIYDLNYNLALQNLYKAVELHESQIKKPNRLLALVYGNMGLTYFKLGQFEKALLFQDKCLRLAEELNQVVLYSMFLGEQVQTKMALGQYENAIPDLEKTLELQDQTGDWESKMETLFNFAELEIGLKKYESAFKHAEQAYSISQKHGFVLRSASSLSSMAHALRGQGKITEALVYAKKALLAGKTIESPMIEAEAFEILHKLYAQLGHIDSAYTFALKFNEAEERITLSKRDEIAEELGAKYNMQKKEQEIAFLQQSQSQQRILLLLAVGASVLLFALLILVIRSYLSKGRTAAKLNHQNIALESANRELRIAEEALNQKNDELNKYIDSNMQLENFAYLASHDLREPITNVLGFSDYLMKNYSSNMDEMGQRCLGFIKDSSKRMEYLTSDLLTYSIIGKDKNFESISCMHTLKEVLQDLSTSIVEGQADISYSQLPNIYGNPTEVRLLFQNLISNAIKYKKPKAQAKIQIQGSLEGNFVKFSVKDNGIGISLDFQKKVFLMFKRNDVENKYKGNSTGIGLAICKRVVESHNGMIWLDSAVGVGSTFFFTLPHKANSINIKPN